MSKTYLGDGVYVQREPHYPPSLELTTSDGYRDTNRIVLEPEVLDALLLFALGAAALAAARKAQ